MTIVDETPIVGDGPAASPPDDDDLDRRLGRLPRWRRPAPLRRRLSVAFAVAAFVSVSLVAGVNYLAARQLLGTGTQDQLVGIAESRVRSIEQATGRALTGVSALSSDLAVTVALEELVAAYDALEDDDTALEPEQSEALDDAYRTEVIEPLAAIDVEASVESLRPETDVGQYLQFHYTLRDPEERRSIDDPGDGSDYSRVHAKHHPYLRSVAEEFGGDIKLVSDDGNIVYTVDKRIDFGTNLETGPYRDTTLAQTARTTLPRQRAGRAVISDFELYLPGGINSTGFAMATVRNGTEVTGAIVAELPIESVNVITTAGGDWESVGLEDGESYAVGSDAVLRSESRIWIEEPERYLDRIDDEVLANRIELLGSPVGLQPVDTPAVRAALDGETFRGRSTNYLGDDTYAYARQIDLAGVNWVVVAEVPLDTARAPLIDYLIRIGLTLLVLLPIAALIGAVMAARLTRPVPLIVDAARAVAEGERDPDLPDFGRNEFGDLAVRLQRTARALGDREQALEASYDETRTILLSAVPPRVVGDGRTTSGTGEAIDHATAIAIRVDVLEDAEADEGLSDLLAASARRAEELAAQNGIERVRAAADQYLFVAGLGDPASGADAALGLASGFARKFREVARRDDLPVTFRIGVSTGTVETGLLQRGQLSFTAWGAPVRNAMVIATMSEPGVVGVDATTVHADVDEQWHFEERAVLSDLDERPLETYSLVISEVAASSPGGNGGGAGTGSVTASGEGDGHGAGRTTTGAAATELPQSSQSSQSSQSPVSPGSGDRGGNEQPQT